MPSDTAGVGEPRAFTVAELADALRGLLQYSFPDDLWVEGEIRNMNRSRTGHVYFELVDPDTMPGQAPSAMLSVVLFKTTRELVNQHIRRSGAAIRMDDGVRIRIRAVPDLYPPTGRLQLRMTGIDPTYTLGQMLSARDRLIGQLREEGVLTRNQLVEFPLLPLHIGLVTAASSAACADFLNELESSGIGFTVTLVDAPVQGDQAPFAVAAALATCERAGAQVIALVRGGGARTDLVAFDHELVARAIVARSVPVLTGVGHEIDSSVADAVAHLALKTPTACAAHLAEAVCAVDRQLADHQTRLARLATARLREQERRLVALGRQIQLAPRGSLVRAGAQLERHRHRLVERTGVRLVAAGRRLDHATATLEVAPNLSLAAANRRVAAAADDLLRQPTRALGSHTRRVDELDARRRLLDPARLLARGWSITTDRDGVVVRSASQVAAGATLRTRVGDGAITSTVTEVTT